MLSYFLCKAVTIKNKTFHNLSTLYVDSDKSELMAKTLFFFFQKNIIYGILNKKKMTFIIWTNSVA